MLRQLKRRLFELAVEEIRISQLVANTGAMAQLQRAPIAGNGFRQLIGVPICLASFRT